MSIYPVSLAKWYPRGDSQHKLVVLILKCSSCIRCGKKNLHWQKAWAHHSLPFGYGDIWCRERCYKKGYKS